MYDVTIYYDNDKGDGVLIERVSVWSVLLRKIGYGLAFVPGCAHVGLALLMREHQTPISVEITADAQTIRQTARVMGLTEFQYPRGEK